MTDVLTVGECMVSLRCQGLISLGAAMTTSVAGAEATVAIGLSRLGHDSRWVGRVGDDQSGRLIVRTLRAEVVAVDQIVDDRASTGMVVFEQRLPDVTRVEYHRHGSAGSRLEPGDLGDLIARERPRVVHMTGITAALSDTALETVAHSIDQARSVGAAVSFDLNYRSALWSRERAASVLAGLAERADIVVGSDDEFELIGRHPQDLLTATPQDVVVKRGADGAIGFTRGATPISVRARQVPVVDSIGAGDAFTAGYLSAWLDGLDLSGRLQRATVLGGFAVATRGDWEGLPVRTELDLLGLDLGSALR